MPTEGDGGGTKTDDAGAAGQGYSSPLLDSEYDDASAASSARSSTRLASSGPSTSVRRKAAATKAATAACRCCCRMLEKPLRPPRCIAGARLARCRAW